jgi:large subunit ribosomal protein L22
MNFMEIKASVNYLRIAPRKTRLVVDLVRGMDVDKAKAVLQFAEQKSARPILKLLNSALADAENNYQLNKEVIKNLYIKSITVDEGPKLKRWMPVSRGTAHQIQKKTSHVTLVLDEKPKQETKIIKNKNQIVGKTKQNSKVKHE